MFIVAHRGDTSSARENTLPAFESAIRKGADTIELDIHCTADACLVVHHDYAVNLRPNLRQHIHVLSRSKLDGLALAADGNTYAIPSLADVLDLGLGKVRFEMELKCPERSCIDLALAEIDSFGVADDVEITSGHVPVLSYVGSVRPDLQRGIFFSLYPDWKDEALGQQHAIAWLDLLCATVAHLPFALINRAFVDELHANGCLVHGAELNVRDEIVTAFELGIDQFSTDALDLALEVRSDTGER